ncbi:MAG TPA: hypothetical protein VMI75_16250, partial [Polyangiaceae bacterium]|nr:hypothetical protein [Polyangiaceae bacterium]
MRRALLVAFAASVACGACGGSKRAAPAAPSIVVAPLQHPTVSHDADAAHAPARSHLVGTIERNAMGPFMARASFGGMVVWIRPAPRGGGQELVVVPIGQDGAPFSVPHVVAPVPQEATSLVVRPTGVAHGGWLVAWTALLDRGESLSVLGVTPDGSTHGSPYDVQRTVDHVKWADVVPSPTGGMSVWAEETPSGDANMLAAPVDEDGKPRGLPVRIARGVRGWAAARDGDGVALALVGPPADAATAGAAGASSVSLVRLDADGRPRAAPITVTGRTNVSGDVDLLAANGGWLLGWTDHGGEDAQVMLATVDSAGRVGGPKRALEAVGGAALVGIASGPAGMALAWEEPRGRARPMRAVHLAAVTFEGPAAQPVSSLDVASVPPPELVATDAGFGLLATAHACKAEEGPSCKGPLAPTFVRLDPRLQAAQAEPLLLGKERAPAAMGWNLRCLSDTCLALAADSSTPTGVLTMTLAPRAAPFAVPTMPPAPADAPRVSGVVTIASGQPFADLATAAVGDRTFVATITSAVDGVMPHRKRRGGEGSGATVSVRGFDHDGQPTGPPASLTSRAISAGGVAVAAGGKLEDGAAVAWVGRDAGDPQVHVAHLDKRGRRTNEVQLTTAKGDASDVAIAWAGDGWLVAWVDTRDGNGEVYATKVDHDLQRTAREERITKAPGDAADVSLVVRDDTAWVAWTDPRESPTEGIGDIYVTTLHTRDAKRAGDEIRVLTTAAHSRSPRLALAGDGALVAWIEDPPTGVDAPGTAEIARLDATAHVLGAGQRLPLASSGSPATLVLESAGDGVRAFAARSSGQDVTIDAVALRGDGTAASPPWTLVDLDAPSSFDVALSVTGDAVFFDDIGAAPADHRIRRASVAW